MNAYKLIPRALLLATLTVSSFAWTASANADQIDDIVNLSVDALVIGGSQIGVNISESEKNIVKPLASCIAHGKPVAECAKEAVIKQLPPEIQQQVLCASSGSNIAQCATAFLPPEAQAPAQCLSQGKTVDQCAAEEIVKRLPPGSQGLANCIAVDRKPVAQCAQEFGQQQAAKVLNETVTNAAGQIPGNVRGVLNNIIKIVEGVNEKDIQKVLQNGGEVVAKAVARFAIRILTAGTPFVDVLTGPVVDAVIEHRVDALVGVFEAVKENNRAKLAEVLTNAYFTMFAVVPCAALQTLVPVSAINEALCGGAGKVIQVIASGVGSVVGVIDDALSDLGVFSVIDDVFKFITSNSNKPKGFCGTPSQYYASHHAMCLQRAVYQKLKDAETSTLIDGPEFRDVLDRVNISCRQHFEQCYDGSDTLSKLCDPLKQIFVNQAEELYMGLARAANVIINEETMKLRMTRLTSNNMCEPSRRGQVVQDVTNKCVGLVSNRFPLPPEPPGAGFCAPDLTEMPKSPAQKACEAMTVHRDGQTPWVRNTAQQIDNRCAPTPVSAFAIPERLTPLDPVKEKARRTDLLGSLITPINTRENLKTGNNPMPGLIGGMNPTGPGGPKPSDFDSDQATRLLETFSNTPPASSFRTGNQPQLPVNPPLTGGTNNAQPGNNIPPQVRASRGPAFPQQPTGGMNATQNVPQQPRYQHDPAASAMVSGFIGGALNNAINNRSRGGNSGFAGGAPGNGTNVTTSGQRVTGGMNQTQPGQNLAKSGNKTPDRRINYGSCSNCKPSTGGGYPGLR